LLGAVWPTRFPSLLIEPDVRISRHPALRLASSQGPRLRSIVHEPEVVHANVAVDGFDRKASRAVATHLCAAELPWEKVHNLVHYGRGSAVHEGGHG
jgi:hypothetical protein